MEPLSAPPRTGSICWQRLLFTASLLTFWSSPTSAQATIELVPPLVAEGKNVLLLVHNLPENLSIIYWYKGTSTNDDYEIARYLLSTNEPVKGLAHSGRETIFSNGSLLIENVKQDDTGVYTLQTLDNRGSKKDTPVELYVHQPVSQPSITVTSKTVKENDSVVFTCVSGDSEISIQWIFNNQNLKLTDRMMLSQNNSRLSIDPVEREDAGEYQCEVSNLVSSKKSSSISLIVNTDSGQGSSGLSGGAIAGIVVGAVAGVALIAGLGYFLYSRKTGRGSDQHNLTEHTPSASNHSPGPSDNCPKKVDEVPYSVLEFNAQKPKQPAPASSVSETVYSQVKKN